MKNVDKQRLYKMIWYSDTEFTMLLRKVLGKDTVQFMVYDSGKFAITYLDSIGVKTHLTYIDLVEIYKKLSEYFGVEVYDFDKGDGCVWIEYIDNEREENLCYYIKCQAERINILEKKMYQLECQKNLKNDLRNF